MDEPRKTPVTQTSGTEDGSVAKLESTEKAANATPLVTTEKAASTEPLVTTVTGPITSDKVVEQRRACAAAVADSAKAHADGTFSLGKPSLPSPVDGFPDFGHLKMAGVPNIRDLGGMPAAGGKRVAPHRLIRSGALHHLDAKDAKELLGSCQLKRVVDFRTPAERKRAADKADLLPGVRFYDLPVFEESAIGVTHEHNPLGDLRMFLEISKDPVEVMDSMYIRALTAEEGIHAYASFLDVLLNADEGATLWHCTEGKDRAGLGSFLVETALGVPEEVRINDYEATNLFVKNWVKKMLDALGRHHLAKVADGDIDSFFYAQRAFLQAAVDEVTKLYGSVEAYMTEALRFGPGKREKLRAMYLV